MKLSTRLDSSRYSFLFLLPLFWDFPLSKQFHLFLLPGTETNQFKESTYQPFLEDGLDGGEELCHAFLFVALQSRRLDERHPHVLVRFFRRRDGRARWRILLGLRVCDAKVSTIYHDQTFGGLFGADDVLPTNGGDGRVWAIRCLLLLGAPLGLALSLVKLVTRAA